MVLLSASCRHQPETRVLKLAHGLPVSHPVHKGIVRMAELLQMKSGGSMRVDIYPGGQLGGERELMELLQIGSIALTKVSSSPMASFVPEMQVFSIPYLFRDEDHLWRVLNGETGKRLLQAGEKYYLRGLCFYDAGSRSFYTKEVPVRKPADLAGLKIRVQKSRTDVRMVQSLGGSATPITWGELYTSLQQGVVDGAENNPPSFYLSRHYEVCRYYSLDEHTCPPDILLVSTHVWNRLSEQERMWLQQAADESVGCQRQIWKETTRQSLQAVQEAGVEIIRPNKQKFREAVQDMHREYLKTPLGPLLQEIAGQ